MVRSTAMTHTDIIVVGGGLCGVTFSHFAAREGKKIALLERRDTLGGCIHTVFPNGEESDFFVESGAHTIYNSYGTIIEMIKNMHIRHNIIPQTKNGYLMWDGEKLNSVFSHISWPGFIAGAFKMLFNKQHGHTVEEYFTKVLGRKNFEKLIRPSFSAIICQDASQVAADLVLKSRKKDKSYPRSFSMLGGLHTLLRSASSVDGITVHTGTAAVSVKYENGMYTVETDNAGTFTAKQLVMAATAHESADLIENIYPDISAMLKELPLKESRAVSFCVQKENAAVRPFNYIIARDVNFTAAVSRDAVPCRKYRGATFHFKPGTDSANDEAEIKKVYTLAKDEKLNPVKSVFKLPQLGTFHYEWRKKLEGQLDKIDNFYLLGNFFDGMSLEDCAIRGKKEAIRASKRS